MTNYYVGSGGNDANAGTTWALRRLTLTSIETLVAAGDIVYVAPGVYRETLTCTASGGSQYTTGTVTVTNGSAVVTGSGTSWLANAFANGQFRTTSLAAAADGVANGTTTFTSVGGNFQAGHVGLVIQIAGKGAYTITARASATSITLSGSPVAGSSLSYSIMTPGHIEILSVDTNTQITLKQPWVYPSFTGLAYETYKDIKYIADVTGVNTDGVGGIVRVTGSDNDQTATRGTCLTISTLNYRTFRGFMFDTGSSTLATGNGGADCIIEDCNFVGNPNGGLLVQAAAQLRWTIRRCRFEQNGAVGVQFTHSSTVSDANHVVENCVIVSKGVAVQDTRVGGVMVRNCDIISGSTGVAIGTALAVGQAVVVNNSIIYQSLTGLSCTTVLEFVEDYNDLYVDGTPRTTVAVGSNSQAYPPLLQPQIFVNGAIYTLIPYSLSQWSSLRSIAGINPPYEDLYGTVRAATSSWGAVQYSATQRPSDAGEPRGSGGNNQ